MKKIFVCLLCLLMMLSLFTSCSDGGTMNEGSYKADSGYVPGDSYTSNDAESVTDGKTTEDLERKIIKTYRVRMETKTYDSAADKITAAVKSFGGYVAEASQEGSNVYTSDDYSYRTRSASFTIRVPASKADAFLAYISEGENVLSSSLHTEDVTDSYYGYKAQLESLVIQEERLTAMLEKAEYLDELLTLEDRLSQVRAEINGIHSRLQLMEKSVDYSYVYLTLNEVKEYKEPEKESYLARVFDSFGDAFASFAEVIGEIFIVFIWLLPYLLVLGVVVAVIMLLTMRGRRRKAVKSEQKSEIEKKESNEA